MIIGIVIGVIALVLIIAVPTFVYFTRRKKQAQNLPAATFVSPAEIAVATFPYENFDRPTFTTE